MVRQTVQYGGWLLSVVLNVIPCHAATIGASSVVFVGGQKTQIATTLGTQVRFDVDIIGQVPCLFQYIKTSLFSLSGNEIGSVTGKGSIAIPTRVDTAFTIKVNDVGNPPSSCSGTAQVRPLFYDPDGAQIGSAAFVPIEFADSSCSIDVPASVNLPTIVKGETLAPVELTPNPVGKGTLSLVPSNTNGPVTAGKIVSADGTKGIVYQVNNTSWKPAIAGWSGDISTTKSLTFGSTNDVGQFSGALTATISCN